MNNAGYFRQFSNPYEAQVAGISDVILGSSVQAALQLFLKRYQARLREISSGVEAAILLFLDSPATFGECYDSSFGYVEELIKGAPGSSMEEAAVNVVCQLSRLRPTGEWRIRISIPTLNLNFRGISRSLSGVRQVAFDPVDGTIRYWQDFLQGPGKILEEEPGHTSQADEILLVPVGEATGDLQEKLAGQYVSPDPSVAALLVQEALDGLRAAAPDYHRWVSGATRRLLVFDTVSPRQMESGSWEGFPGYYNISINHDAFLIGEMLVHESSHQYLNLVKRVTDLQNAADERRYFSPAVNKMRPIWLILLAYHAFANVLIYHRLALSRYGGDVPLFHRRMEDNEKLVRQLEGHLCKDNSLTPIGRLLFEGLRERIA